MNATAEKILVIDDDYEYLEELSEMLSLHGFRVVEVHDPLAVVEAVERSNPDAILLDLKMPQKSGLQLACELKKTPEFANIPVIAMSAYFTENCSALLQICGIHTCLKKPFHPEDVVTAVSRIIKKVHGTEASE